MGLPQHKLGADRAETFRAVQVDENNRNLNVGPVKEIEVWFCLARFELELIGIFTNRGIRHSISKVAVARLVC
jgi:hypothetical protein